MLVSVIVHLTRSEYRDFISRGANLVDLIMAIMRLSQLNNHINFIGEGYDLRCER
jgi:hypothetical protein